MIPKTIDKEQIEVFVIQPLTKNKLITVKENGKPQKDPYGNTLKIEEEKFVKENWLRVQMYKKDIRVKGEYVGVNGKKVKNRCMIYNSASQAYYKIAHTLDELNFTLSEEIKEKVGFSR